jgi:hypothetical protein
VTERIKKCFKCGEPKPLSAFYKHPQRADGHLNKCKECTKKDVKENRYDKIDYYLEYDRARPNHSDRVSKMAQRVKTLYTESEDFRARVGSYRDSWLSKNAHKRHAQHCVSNAVRDGKITKPGTCSCCGSDGKIYGHHWSYEDDYVLDVVWLCAKCHGLEHKRINQFERDGLGACMGVSKAEDVVPLMMNYIRNLPEHLRSHIDVLDLAD